MPYIPKIIHQIMHNFKESYPPEKSSPIVIPDKWAKSPLEWRRLHPDWTYKLWGGFESRELIRTKYNFLLEKYDSYKYPVQRVDVVRFCILHEYGGIAPDLDLYPVQNIEKYINGNAEAYFVFGKLSAATSFMVSSKGANIWKKIFDNLISYNLPWWIRWSRHFTAVMETGPMLLDKTISEYEDATLGRLPQGFYNHEICKHESKNPVLLALPGQSWCSFDTRVFNFIMANLKLLVILGIIFVILIIILIIYLIYRYVEFKKLLQKCINLKKQ